MTKGNGYIDKVPYRFNTKRALWLRVVTNPIVMIVVFTLIMALFLFGDKL